MNKTKQTKQNKNNYIDVYKVVKKIGNKFYSAWMSGDGKLPYKTKQFINAPKGTALCAFSNLVDAQSWIYELYLPSCYNVVIFKSKALKSKYQPTHFGLTSRCLSKEDIDEYWSDVRKNKGKFQYETVPAGTIFCKSIKLGRKVTQNNVDN